MWGPFEVLLMWPNLSLGRLLNISQTPMTVRCSDFPYDLIHEGRKRNMIAGKISCGLHKRHHTRWHELLLVHEDFNQSLLALDGAKRSSITALNMPNHEHTFSPEDTCKHRQWLTNNQIRDEIHQDAFYFHLLLKSASLFYFGTFILMIFWGFIYKEGNFKYTALLFV